jgi:dTDP-4-amino-4,6-dideoxygalactose transaminase
VLESGYVAQGPKVEEFEHQVAQLVGCGHAFATSSCTTALHLALSALGIGPGDEVLVPDFTFPATANVVVQQGATPVLVDVDLDTYNVTAASLAEKVSPRTRAIMAVHLFGLPVEMEPVMALAAQHRLAVVEDAACALGATYQGRQCGRWGDLGCFSFHARKVITTGEGGMIVTERPDLAARIALLRSHGGIREDRRFRFEAAGFNYRLSDIAAAVGVAQMRRLEHFLARRRALAQGYRERLAGYSQLRCPPEPFGAEHAYQSFVALLADGVDRDGVIRALGAIGVETTLGTYALHDQPFFQRTYGYRTGELPGSHAAYRRSLALPLHPEMVEQDLDAVVDALAAVLNGAAARS